MAAKKLKHETKTQMDELENFRCYTMADVEKITTYDIKTLEKFGREGTFKSRKLNGGKRVTTKKWIIEFLDSISDNGPLEF